MENLVKKRGDLHQRFTGGSLLGSHSEAQTSISQGERHKRCWVSSVAPLQTASRDWWLGETKQLELMGAVGLCQHQPWIPKDKSRVWDVAGWGRKHAVIHESACRIYKVTLAYDINFWTSGYSGAWVQNLIYTADVWICMGLKSKSWSDSWNTDMCEHHSMAA